MNKEEFGLLGATAIRTAAPVIIQAMYDLLLVGCESRDDLTIVLAKLKTVSEVNQELVDRLIEIHRRSK